MTSLRFKGLPSEEEVPRRKDNEGKKLPSLEDLLPAKDFCRCFISVMLLSFCFSGEVLWPPLEEREGGSGSDQDRRAREGVTSPLPWGLDPVASRCPDETDRTVF